MALPLTEHEERSVETVADVHRRHEASATELQKAVNQIVRLTGRPAFWIVVILTMIGWVGYNLSLVAYGGEAPDPPPFEWLDLATTVMAFLFAGLILATQRHADTVSDKRDKLTLELALLNERKSSKIIQLIEELREDSTSVNSRADPESDAMARPADADAVLSEIERRA